MQLTLPRQRALGKRTGPVRVCFFIDRLSRAGTETQLLALIRSLDRTRVRPHLCLLDGEDEVSHSLLPDDCPVLCLGLRSLLGRSTPSALARLRGFWRKYRIDIVQTYFLDSTYLGVPLARLSGIRTVIRVRNNLGHWLTGGHRRLGRLMGRLADLTLTNCDSGKKALIDAEQLPPGKIVVLENGVDMERFPISGPPDTSREQVRVGLVGNLRPVKNIDGLVRVAARLRDSLPQLRFEVAGEGEQRPELEQLIAQHGLTGRFTLCGSVSDVPAFLARQDIALLVSHSEGMSNALLEYMASGRVIVATDVGANSRLVTDGVEGLIVPPRDDAALATSIEWCVRNAELAQEMARLARRRVEAEFSRTAMVWRFEEFYKGLVIGCVR